LIDLLGMLLTNQYSTLILIDMLRGVFGTAQWGWPVTSTLSWNGAFFLIYIEEFIIWWIIPVTTMFWWRSWAKKHPQLVEEL
jgi:hypothetical protein